MLRHLLFGVPKAGWHAPMCHIAIKKLYSVFSFVVKDISYLLPYLSASRGLYLSGLFCSAKCVYLFITPHPVTVQSFVWHVASFNGNIKWVLATTLICSVLRVQPHCKALRCTEVPEPCFVIHLFLEFSSQLLHRPRQGRATGPALRCTYKPQKAATLLEGRCLCDSLSFNLSSRKFVGIWWVSLGVEGSCCQTGRWQLLCGSLPSPSPSPVHDLNEAKLPRARAG